MCIVWPGAPSVARAGLRSGRHQAGADVPLQPPKSRETLASRLARAKASRAPVSPLSWCLSNGCRLQGRAVPRPDIRLLPEPRDATVLPMLQAGKAIHILRIEMLASMACCLSARTRCHSPCRFCQLSHWHGGKLAQSLRCAPDHCRAALASDEPQPQEGTGTGKSRCRCRFGNKLGLPLQHQALSLIQGSLNETDTSSVKSQLLRAPTMICCWGSRQKGPPQPPRLARAGSPAQRLGALAASPATALAEAQRAAWARPPWDI